MNIEKIQKHYNNACEKHPYFCDGLIGRDVYGANPFRSQYEYYSAELRLIRDEVKCRSKNGTLWVSGASLGASVWFIVCAAKKECDK